MFDYVKKNKALAVIAGLALTAVVAVPVMAQRDPAYEAARSSGKIGEKPDGYLGFVTAPSPAIKAQETNSTVEQFAFTSGCNLIMRTAQGEKYQTPAGTWNTRDASEPVRDSRCP